MPRRKLAVVFTATLMAIFGLTLLLSVEAHAQATDPDSGDSGAQDPAGGGGGGGAQDPAGGGEIGRAHV